MDLRPILEDLRQGRNQTARHSCEQLLAAGHEGAPLRSLLARACLAGGDIVAARQALDAALVQDREFPPAWIERAMLARIDGRLDQAIAALSEAWRLLPLQAPIALDLANALALNGEGLRAEQVLAESLRYAANFAPGWMRRGELALERGDALAAHQCYTQASQLAPNDASAWRGLADAAEALGRSVEELLARERACALAPDSAATQAELGDALRRDEQTDRAQPVFERALALAPDDLLIRWMRMQTLPAVCDSDAQRLAVVDDWRSRLDEFEQLVQAPIKPATALGILSSATNFYRHYLGEPLLDDQRRYGAVLGRLAQCAFPDAQVAPPRSGGTRKRIGFVSSHFYEHTVLKHFGSWVGALDRERYDTVGIHLDTREDAWTARMRAQCATWIPARDTLSETIQAVRDARLDMLIHLDVGMHPHQQALAALRLAPHQAATWGHPITTGLDSIDSFLSSDAMELADAQSRYSERLVRLPRLGLCYPAPAGVDVDYVPPLPPAARGYLLCAQSAQKLQPVHDELFVDLAQACPDYPLVLIPHHRANVIAALQVRLHRAFAARGMDPTRHLVLLPVMPHPQFLAVARGARVVVDSLDWSGSNTSLEILHGATPIVCLPGITLRSRHTAAMLALMGAPGIAANHLDYVQQVSRLVHDDDHHRDTARAIATARHELFDDPRPLQGLRDFVDARCA